MTTRLKIKELAQAQKLNQQQLAEKSGVNVQLLNRYWNNNMQRVSLEHLHMIASALGVKVADLFEEEKEESGSPQRELKPAA